MVNPRSFRKRRYGGGRSTKRGTYGRSAFIGPMNLIGPRRKPLNYRTGGFLGLENKFRDFVHVDDAFTTTWTTMEPAASVESISVVAQGDTESTRDGRVYHIKSLHVQGHVTRVAVEAGTAPPDDIICRVVCVLDTQTNAAQLTATEVMLAATSNVTSWRNLQFTDRFKILFDKKFILVAKTTNEGAVNSFSSQISWKTFKFNHTFKSPIKVTCKSTEAAVASVTDNSIHIIGTATSTLALLNYNSRIRYVG